jgi:hypothetical protein
MNRIFLIAIFSLSLCSCGYIAYQLYGDVMERKEQKEDLAEINRVNYELFNVETWKQEALQIFQKKIKEFEISEETYVVLDQQVQGYLNQLYKDYFESGELMDMILENMESSGKINKMFLNIIKTNVVEQLDQLDLKSKIPGLSKQVTNEIKKNEPLLRSYMQKELLRLILDEASTQYADQRVRIYAKYDLAELKETEDHLKDSIVQYDNKVKGRTTWLIGLLVLCLLVCLIAYRNSISLAIGGMTLVSVILLLLGITLPMIDIDARLNAFVFKLMGEPIAFDEQVIYFQSKSIVEVTKTLWTGGGIDLKAVGLLVFLFSIVFPFFKLILSALFLFVDKVRKSAFAKTVIFHLGKWSMADVFVVAIFMAYIGMYGILSSQLGSISRNEGGFAIETINYSRLSPGAFYFTAYTLLSIFIGILINRKIEKQNK